MAATNNNTNQLLRWARDDFKPPKSSQEVQALLRSPESSAKAISHLVICHVFDCYDCSESHQTEALGYVTRWLSYDPPDEPQLEGHVPSLQRLCAQTLAARAYQRIIAQVTSVEVPFSIEWEERMSIHDRFRQVGANSSRELAEDIDRAVLQSVENSILSSRSSEVISPVPDTSWQMIVDETYIFVIVHMLYRDLRNIRYEPADVHDLELPLEPPKDKVEFWWNDTGQWDVEEVVPMTGRASPAKMVILVHAMLVNFTKALPKTIDTSKKNWNAGIRGGYDYFGYLTLAVENIFHPLQLQLMLPCIQTLVVAILGVGDSRDIWEQNEAHLSDTMYPFFKGTMDILNQDRMDDLLKFMNAWPTVSPEFIKKMALKPFPNINWKLPSDARQCLEKCMIDFKDDFVSLDNMNLTPCVRLRLRGNWTREEILERVLVSSSVSFLDLRGCRNLDETSLEAITNYCWQLKAIFLHDTPIKENSPALLALRKDANRKVRIDFSGSLEATRCLCGCGHLALIDRSGF